MSGVGELPLQLGEIYESGDLGSFPWEFGEQDPGYASSHLGGFPLQLGAPLGSTNSGGMGGFAWQLGGPGRPTPPFRPRTPSGGMPVGRYYVTVGGERLDQVAQSAYGFQVGAVEALLVWNHGLGALGFTLPANVAIELPDLIAPTSTKATSREVALWG